MKRATIRLARMLIQAVRPASRKPDVYPDANPLYAHRCHAGRVERWHPVSSGSTCDEANGLADGIFQPPGFVSVDGSVFDLRAEGVYRFYRLARLSEQRIVWHGGLDSLLSMLGYLWVYGSVDNAIAAEPAAALDAARRGVVVATCTCLARLGVAVMAEGNLAARPVALVTLDPWGGYDDGHTLVEVKSSEAGWFLYDPSFNLCFLENGRRLSLLETVDSLKLRRVALERLPGNTGHAIHRVDGYDYGFWLAERFYSDAILYGWYLRLAGVSLIQGDGAYAFVSDGLATDDRERLARRRYRAMRRDAFMARFYGESTKNNPPLVNSTATVNAPARGRGAPA